MAITSGNAVAANEYSRLHTRTYDAKREVRVDKKVAATALLGLVIFGYQAHAQEVVLRSRSVRADLESIRETRQVGESLSLRLFNDVNLTAIAEWVEDNPLNGFVWDGHIKGDSESTVVLLVSGESIWVHVSTASAYYRIRPGRSGAARTDSWQSDVG